MLNRIKNLLLLIIFCWYIGLSSAQAETIAFQWNGQNGYSMKGNLNYEKYTPERFLEIKANQPSQALKSLKVSFYQPNGKLESRYENVYLPAEANTQPLVSNPFVRLTFDAQNQQFIGKIDLGGSQPGEIYLKGEMEKNLQLIRIDAKGKEQIADQNMAWIACAKNPLDIVTFPIEE